MRTPASGEQALAKRVMAHAKGSQVTRPLEEGLPMRFTEGVWL